MLFAAALLVLLHHDAEVLVQCEMCNLLSALPMEVLNKQFELVWTMMGIASLTQCDHQRRFDKEDLYMYTYQIIIIII